jgi:hypothetical protein
MNLNQKFVIVLLATFSGFIGGFISNELFSTKSAFAKKEPKHQKVIIAEEYRLVDKRGILRARLGFDPTFQQTELGLSSPKVDPSTAPQILLSVGSSGGFLRIDSGTHHDIFAYRAILSAHEGQAKMRIGRIVSVLPVSLHSSKFCSSPSQRLINCQLFQKNGGRIIETDGIFTCDWINSARG